MRIRKGVVLALFVPASLLLAVLGSAGGARAATAGLSFKANQSNNWSGYNVGALQNGSPTPINSVSATWTVPTASQHTAKEAESSAVWTGIGGGCVDANCAVGDATLIQAGTEQDVNPDGSTAYSAWWEVIPAPSVTVNLTIHPKDQMFVKIAQSGVPEVWNITITDQTTSQSAKATVDPTPYPSDYSTAEYIVETPLVTGTSGTGLAAMPNLTSPAFDNATINGAPAALTAGEEMQLTGTDNSGNTVVIAQPSAPDSNNDGFNVCTWPSPNGVDTASCAAPTST
jgi:hypothetical protein